MTEWSLSSDAFQRLLSVLDADPDSAARAYERLRVRTIGLFRWWGAADADALADAALDRVARKLSEGTSVRGEAIGAYVRGVARMILHESRRADERRAAAAAVPPPAAADERVLGCLDSCLARLETPERDLVLRYYADGKAADVRRRLSVDMGVSPGALRLRAHRLRVQLEGCVSGCAALHETFSVVPSFRSEARPE